jgi:hypothetical protein
VLRRLRATDLANRYLQSFVALQLSGGRQVLDHGVI